MRRSRIIFSCLELLLILSGAGGGIYLITLAYNSSSSDFLFLSSSALTALGIALFSFSCLLCLTALFLYRSQFFVLHLGGMEALTAEKGVLKKFVQHSLEEEFPLNDFDLVSLYLKKRRIHLELALSPFNFEQMVENLERIEKKLAETFFKQFGYKEEFIVCVQVKAK